MAEKIYRVNMTTLTASAEDVPQEWERLAAEPLPPP